MNETSAHPKVLVVDDNHDAADMLASLLGFMAFETRVAYDGREAVELAKSFHPDMVILDLEMPAMDGLQAARALRAAETGEQPAILVALTGHSDPQDRVATARAGFDAHLSKPIDGHKLCDLTERLVRCVRPGGAREVPSP